MKHSCLKNAKDYENPPSPPFVKGGNSPLWKRGVRGDSQEKNNESVKIERFLGRRAGIVLVLVGFILLSAAGCATSPQSKSAETAIGNPETIQERWGIEIQGIGLTAAGYMLDFRYRIVDPDKAAAITDPKLKPYLIDQTSGAKFIVPNPPKIGPLRQTSRSGKPEAGRTYFIVFGNPGQYIKQGSKVSVVIGDFKAEDLIVN